MTETQPQNNAGYRLWKFMQRGTSHVVAGAAFALPGFLLIYQFNLEMSGYYLIAAVAMIGHVTLRSLSDFDQTESDIDLSAFRRRDLILFLLIVTVSVTIGVGIRLGIAAIASSLVASSASQQVYGVLTAGIIPILDRKLADTDVRMSPSAIATIASFKAGIAIIAVREQIDYLLPDQLNSGSYRFGPI